MCLDTYTCVSLIWPDFQSHSVTIWFASYTEIVIFCIRPSSSEFLETHIKIWSSQKCQLVEMIVSWIKCIALVNYCSAIVKVVKDRIWCKMHDTSYKYLSQILHILFYPAFCNQSNEKETKINVKIHRQHQLYLLYKVDISESLKNVEVENWSPLYFCQFNYSV